MPDSGAAALIPDTLDASRPDARWLRLEQVGYRAGATRILSDITLDLGAGPPTVVIGPNGSGKTTLLRLMMGLIAPTEGRVLLAARADGGERRRAFMFQKPVMLRRTAAANVAFALHASGRSFDEAAVTALLGRVGLAELGRRPARRLSGGEQQRLALARALARAPEILLLDEPTASLDPAQSKAVEEIVANVMRAGVKVVLATHDLGQARRLAGDVVFLANGRLIEHAPASQFFAEPASEAARRFLAGDLVL